MNKKKADKLYISKFDTKYKEIVDGTKKIISGEVSQISDLPEILFDSRYSKTFCENISDSENFKKNYDLINNAYENRDVKKLLNRIEKRKKKNRLFYSLSSAAAALVLITLFVYQNNQYIYEEVAVIDKKEYVVVPTIYTENNPPVTLDTLHKKSTAKELAQLVPLDKSQVKYVVKEQKLVVPKGYTYTVILDDSSEVTLNAASELVYPTTFNDSIRTVNFSGEGYFKIKKDVRPFTVNCNGVEVKVYGTEFNIKSKDSMKLETILVEGSVGVFINGEREVKMISNQLLVYEKIYNKIVLKDVEAPSYIQWIDGNLNYDKYPLKDIITDLENWYNVEFETKADISDVYVTFFSSKDNNLEKILNIIDRISNVKFINKGGDKYKIVEK